MTLLVLGVGNPILGDDGVGIYVARELKKRLPPEAFFEIDEIETGGLDLVERILDYDRVIIIDSTISGKNPIGTINRLAADDFAVSTRSANIHGLAFPEVLERLKKAMPNRIPQSIKVYVIEISKEYIFSEILSDPIQNAAEKVITEIFDLLSAKIDLRQKKKNNKKERTKMNNKKTANHPKKNHSKVEGKITMAHGAGGSVMQKFLSQFVLANFGRSRATVPLTALDDSSVINDTAFSIDAHTVKPLFFPGGDIGRLAVAGTVNDLLAIGAKPSALALSLVLEEGLSLDIVNKIMLSIEQTAKEAEVSIITGDTKTMENGAVDKCIVTTAGIGNRHPNLDKNAKVVRQYRSNPNDWLLDSALKSGDQIILNGFIADHGVAILSAREGYGFETEIESDVQPLTALMNSILGSGGVVASKDPTRGGVASALHEWAQKSQIHLHIQEERIPIREGTQAACEMLGLDPLTIGNEGKFLIAVVKEELENLLKIIRKHPLGKNAQHIGEAKKGTAHVTMETKIGGSRLVPPPVGDPIPRIC